MRLDRTYVYMYGDSDIVYDTLDNWYKRLGKARVDYLLKEKRLLNFIWGREYA